MMMKISHLDCSEGQMLVKCDYNYVCRRKIQLAGFLKLSGWCKFSCQIEMFSHFIFRRQPAEFFFSKQIRQMKAGQNHKYDITNTWSLEHVWFHDYAKVGRYSKLIVKVIFLFLPYLVKLSKSILVF